MVVQQTPSSDSVFEQIKAAIQKRAENTLKKYSRKKNIKSLAKTVLFISLFILGCCYELKDRHINATIYRCIFHELQTMLPGVHLSNPYPIMIALAVLSLQYGKMLREKLHMFSKNRRPIRINYKRMSRYARKFYIGVFDIIHIRNDLQGSFAMFKVIMM